MEKEEYVFESTIISLSNNDTETVNTSSFKEYYY